MVALHACVAFLFAVSGIQALCPDLWTQFHGSCYYFFEDEEEWPQANSVCQTYNARLVSIEDSDENTFIENYVKHKQVTVNDYVWIGANDVMMQGNWRWVGINKKLTFTDWQQGQPDNHYGVRENCVAVYRKTGKWHDVPCNLRYHYICETSPEESIVG